ncbi:hypothetical protein DHEL01_v210845 [Diaporthe helianthi]|uniref:Uncharacterized protein n=1 Tax=Diaporthe helianthi TaxID=158607 RepID=A0A2P5HKH6_DIAHE|nr:hypothetical protein DHEL01_v210845 [Diaporthe helianthi]
MSFRLLPVTRSSLSPASCSRTSKLFATRQFAPLRSASSAQQPTVRIDQTKNSNRPDESPKPEHEKQGNIARELEGEKGAAQSHPAKQPDPQPSPERYTGVQPSGPESKAGEGKAGAMHKE